MKEMNKKLILIIIISIISISSIIGFNLYSNIKNPKSEIVISVETGDDVTSVINKVIDSGVGVSFKSLEKEFREVDGKVYVNNYLLNTKMNAKEIVSILNTQKSNYEGGTFVIREGVSISEIANDLSVISKGIYTKEQIVDYWKNEQNLNRYLDSYWFLTEDIKKPELLFPLEGYFASATYPLLENFDLEKTTISFLNAMDNKLKDFDTEEKRGGYTIQEVLALASIIERETQSSEDKYMVSGVFHNRFDQNMRLQSDITVLYALQEHKQTVLYKDLEVDSPFNTYKNHGIPPGPISTVSYDSIAAASNPTKNDYLFFFATQDTGKVIYTKTYEEHLIVSEENRWVVE